MTNTETSRPVEPDNAHQTTPAPVATPLDPTVQATHYVVSCLPEGHEDRLTYSVQVEYRGKDWWAVKQRGKTLGGDLVWSWGFRWDGEPAEPTTDAEQTEHDRQQSAWLADHRFDFESAMELAKHVAPRLTYRGRSVADALADAGSAV